MMGIIPGMGLSVAIALVALIVSDLHPSFDRLVVSIIIGMLIANFIEERSFLRRGVDRAIKVFLPIGIAAYGTQLTVKGANLLLFPAVLAVFFLLFFLIFGVAKLFGVERRLSLLLATGFSVCGASAIAIVSPLMKARNEETSYAVIVVMMFGLFGMIFFPVLGPYLHLTPVEFAFFTGTMLPMLGQVKVAAMSYGAESLAMAVNFKLLRIAMLVVLVTLAVMLTGGERKKFYIPWYIALFVVFVILVNMFDLPWLTRVALPVSSLSLSTALAAIGLSVDFDAITEAGASPMLAAGMVWLIVFIVVYMGMGFLHG